MKNITETLQLSGLRPTKQRIWLGELLFSGQDQHITAEGLFEKALIAKIPVSLATVYNTLNQFTEAGLLTELSVDQGKTYFDTNTQKHHHFYEEDSGRLIDIPEGSIKIENLPSPPDDMEVEDITLMIKIKPKKEKG